MVAEKTLRFQGKNKNLNDLSQLLQQELGGKGYKIQSRQLPSGYLIQAQKAGILRDIITADRAFSIMISGEPDDFSIRVGVGKFVQNLAVVAAEVILLSELFLVVDIPEMLWTIHVEKEIIRDINSVVG